MRGCVVSVVSVSVVSVVSVMALSPLPPPPAFISYQQAGGEEDIKHTTHQTYRYW